MSEIIVLKGNEASKQKLAATLANINYRVIDFDNKVREYVVKEKYNAKKVKDLRISLKFNLENKMFNKEKIVLLASYISCEELKEIEQIANFHSYQFLKRKV